MEKQIIFVPNIIMIVFPYDAELIQFVRDNIPGRRWDPDSRTWTCPLTSLPEVIDLLGPKGFRIPKVLESLREYAEAEREKKKQVLEQETKARDQLFQRIASGEEAAFIPSANSSLTRKLKSHKAYEAIKQKGYYGKQTIGLRVIESDLQSVLSDISLPTDPETRLCELLSYTWNINAEAKEKRKKHYLSSQYRYMKKGPLLDELCRLAAKQNVYKWGWKEDPNPPVNDADWVLYFERDGVQCSFHAFGRGEGPDFDGDWDKVIHQTFPFEQHLSEKSVLR